MLKNVLLIFLLGCTTSIFAQDENLTQVSKSDIGSKDVPFAAIENVPVFPECTGATNSELKDCMSSKISQFVNLHYDIKKIQGMDLPPNTYRTAVQFKIDKQGKVVDVRARAIHPALEEEAVRVVSNLPQMQPGKQKGEAVGVLYSLPIIFKIDAPKETAKSPKKRKSKD